ncbi:MAG: RNA-binding S4 domain-containing protein [Deltaproteobacteria bacterium]|nr:RNA-binding S4 domain-containing protein [Deltaproteobacteria bacterium]
MQQFVITDAYIELNKLLKASGLCDTGGQAKIVIEDGLVTVEGETETRKRRKIRPGMTINYNNSDLQVIFDKSNAHA